MKALVICLSPDYLLNDEENVLNWFHQLTLKPDVIHRPKLIDIELLEFENQTFRQSQIHKITPKTNE